MTDSLHYTLEARLTTYAEEVKEHYISVEFTTRGRSGTSLVGKDIFSHSVSVENTEVFLCMDKPLVKSQDFLSRTMYRYDGLRLGKGDKDEYAITNREAVCRQWGKISFFLQKDYVGYFAEDYIRRIDDFMTGIETESSPLRNYLFLGLILWIPIQDIQLGWRRSRKVMLSDFDDTLFMESLECEAIDNGQRIISISGGAVESVDCGVDKFYGRSLFSENSIFPLWTQLEADYKKDEMNVNWKFELSRKGGK